MIYKWRYDKLAFDMTYEFDAKNKADEIHQVKEWAKENKWKFKDMVKEDK